MYNYGRQSLTPLEALLAACCMSAWLEERDSVAHAACERDSAATSKDAISSEQGPSLIRRSHSMAHDTCIDSLERLAEEERTANEHMEVNRARKVASTMLFCALYFGIGCAFYMSVEGWDGYESVYFLMVTASTVGYGDLHPSSTNSGSRIFTVLWIFVGICVVFSQLSRMIAELFIPLFRLSRALVVKVVGSRKAIDIDGDGVEDLVEPPHYIIYYSSGLVVPGTIVLIAQVGCAAIFHAIEDMSYGTALYHCLVTSTTVGYGDVCCIHRHRWW